MALEYELTLAGRTPVNQIAERALPDPDDRPTGVAPLLAADLYDRYGFECIVLAGQDGYVEAEGDDNALWSWEPSDYISLTFRLDKFADRTPAIVNMLTVIRRVLDTGTEDAALTQNGDILLLTRTANTLTKHRHPWWNAHPEATHQFPT